MGITNDNANNMNVDISPIMSSPVSMKMTTTESKVKNTDDITNQELFPKIP